MDGSEGTEIGRTHSAEASDGQTDGDCWDSKGMCAGGCSTQSIEQRRGVAGELGKGSEPGAWHSLSTSTWQQHLPPSGFWAVVSDVPSQWPCLSLLNPRLPLKTENPAPRLSLTATCA